MMIHSRKKKNTYVKMGLMSKKVITLVFCMVFLGSLSWAQGEPSPSQLSDQKQPLLTQKVDEHQYLLRFLGKQNFLQWRSIQSEDLMIIEGMQEGRNSPVFNGGNFSPVLDNPTHHFNKWVAENLVG